MALGGICLIGVFANVLAVVAGGSLGALFGHKLPQDFTEKLNSVFGICAIGMGIPSILLMENMPAVILAIVAGTSVGLALHLGDLFTKGAVLLQKPIAKLSASRAGSGAAKDLSLLVTAIVLFCSSGTGIYGTLDAGMTGNCTILLSKSILDLFTAMVFACTLGLVVSVIAIPQAIVFTALFFAAKAILPLTTPAMIADFRACGGFLLIATGLRVAKIKDFPIADMIPSMVLVMPLSALWVTYILPLI